jgi:hypothetical protein
MPRWEPPQEQVIEKPKPRRWPAVVLLLAIIAVAGYGLWMMERRLHPAINPAATAADVRSDISGAGDSLDVAVSWRLADVGAGLPDSMRVEVGRGGGEASQTHVVAGSQRSDTLRIAAPLQGETVSGYSCVAARQSRTVRLDRGQPQGRLRVHGAEWQADRGAVLRVRAARGRAAGQDPELHRRPVLPGAVRNLGPGAGHLIVAAPPTSLLSVR